MSALGPSMVWPGSTAACAAGAKRSAPARTEGSRPRRRRVSTSPCPSNHARPRPRKRAAQLRACSRWSLLPEVEVVHEPVVAFLGQHDLALLPALVDHV